MGRSTICARATRPSLAIGLILSAASLLFTGNVSCSYAADPAAPHPRISQPASDTLALANLQDQFTAVADRVAPSVVAISASVNYIDSDELVGELSPQRLRAALDGVTRTVGTGLIIDSDRYILTNEHVVADTEQIWITTDDHQVYPAVIVGSDPRADLAVLKV